LLAGLVAPLAVVKSKDKSFLVLIFSKISQSEQNRNLKDGQK
jgi:hypothetical protein